MTLVLLAFNPPCNDDDDIYQMSDNAQCGFFFTCIALGVALTSCCYFFIGVALTAAICLSPAIVVIWVIGTILD